MHRGIWIWVESRRRRDVAHLDHHEKLCPSLLRGWAKERQEPGVAGWSGIPVRMGLTKLGIRPGQPTIMTDLMLYQPINVPKPIGPDIWIVDGPIVNMSAVFGMHAPFPTRMTVVKLAQGGLWCHSPIAPDEALFRALDAIGPVQHLVSPNKLHYTHIAAWKHRYPNAVAWASPGVRERARNQRIHVAFDADLEDATPLAWRAEMDQLRFRGSKVMEEFAFFHQASRTLVLTDLIENFEAGKLPRMLRWVGRFGGVLDPDGKTPLDWRSTFRKSIARECFASMLAWHPQQIILAHGRCYLADGERELKRAFRWLT